MKYFSDKPVNTGRQPEIDMSKAFMILLMIMIHAFQGVAPEAKGFLQTIMGYGAGFFGAGSFMIFMGIGMRFSRHQGSKNLVIRGIALLTISQLKNLLVACIPGQIAYRVSGSGLFFEMMLGAIQSDILTFAGLAFLLMALLKKIRMRDEWILLLGVVMNFLMVPAADAAISPENYWVNRILGMFIVTADALFPLCQHFVFAAFWLSHRRVLYQDHGQGSTGKTGAYDLCSHRYSLFCASFFRAVSVPAGIHSGGRTRAGNGRFGSMYGYAYLDRSDV